MTPEQTKAFEEKVYAFVGKPIYAGPRRGYDDVNSAMIRQWCEVMGEKNPAYVDQDWAEKSIISICSYFLRSN